MANETFPGTSGSIVNKTNADTFIPEIWSDEVIASYQKNLVLANLVKKMKMTGKKGDTIHIPKPIRGTASAKAANTQVTIQANVEEELVVTIDKHFEYSRFIEDIVEVQAMSSLRQFYTGDAGYALATQVDDDLFLLGRSFGDGAGADWTNSNVLTPNAGGTGVEAYNGTAAAGAFTDAAFRAAIQRMDDADVPMDGRSFTIPPVLRNAIMGIDRYVSSDFVNSGKVPGGKVGELYGVDIYVTTNAPGVAEGLGAADRAAFLTHRDTMVLAEQLSVRSQTQYKQEFLSTLYTADTLYGVEVYRPESGFVLVV
jgi:hypothetical protein